MSSEGLHAATVWRVGLSDRIKNCSMCSVIYGFCSSRAVQAMGADVLVRPRPASIGPEGLGRQARECEGQPGGLHDQVGS